MVENIIKSKSPLSTDNFSAVITGDKKEIARYLPLGTSLPILPAFRKYINRSLDRFQDVNSILLEVKRETPFNNNADNIEGHVLMYNDGSDTLFFGFFGVFDHDPDKIDYLLDQVVDYATKKGYKRIRGPINVPSNLFGMGFMEEGSSKELFICRPVTPPIYISRFLNSGFKSIIEEDQYDCALFSFNPMDPSNPLSKQFADYEFVYFRSKEEILEYVDDIIDMHVTYMPPSASVTPQIRGSAEEIIDIVCEFGRPEMVWIVKYKPTDEIISCGYILPNMFSSDENGNLDSISMHDWLVHPDHRRNGLTVYMWGMLSQELMAPKGHLTYGIWQVGKENIANSKAAQKMGGILKRTLVIFEKEL